MTKVVLYDDRNIDELIWPSNENGNYAKNYLMPMVKFGVPHFISNVTTKLYVLLIDDLVIPVTVNEHDYENSYVCSPYTHYVTYAIEELRELKSPITESVLKISIHLLGMMLKSCGINKVVCVNNWMLSTNLYPQITFDQLKVITETLQNQFIGYTLMFRSLNELTTNTIIEGLEGLKYSKIASRRSYISDTTIKLKSRASSIVAKDKKLLSENIKWQELTSPSANESHEILALYNQLYLSKYSELNPKFTLEFVNMAIKSRILDLHALLVDDVIQGTVGFFTRNGVMTTPFFGYNLAVPRELGLYRLLSSKLLNEALSTGLVLHQSSGAGEFKRSRGAIPVIEYSLVLTSSTCTRNQLAWAIIKKISNGLAVPMMIRNGL